AAGVDKPNRALGHSHTSMRARETPLLWTLGRGFRFKRDGATRKTRSCDRHHIAHRQSVLVTEYPRAVPTLPQPGPRGILEPRSGPPRNHTWAGFSLAASTLPPLERRSFGRVIFM